MATASAVTYSAADLCAIAAVNSDYILSECLAASPDVASGKLPLITIRDASSMTSAYNEGLSQTDATICLLVHQDVYLPAGFVELALAVLNDLDAHHPDWMIAGPYGVTAKGEHVGRIWDVNMNRELGEAGFAPTAVGSLDELLLILRRPEQFKLDPKLPNFHLYGTDLVQTALNLGQSAWVVELPVVHNNRPWASLSGGFAEAYRYVRRKWRHRLPILTTVCAVSYNPLHLWRVQWRRRNVTPRTEALLGHAPDIARGAGYDEMAGQA